MGMRESSGVPTIDVRPEHGMKVLVADDDVVSRHVLDATLRKWGYDVVSASDGTAALEILQSENAPALAVLDWMMPGYTGLDICRIVRQQSREPYTYILLLTAKSSKEDVITGMDAGADDYVTKPFHQHELQVRLRAGSRIVALQAELMAAREALREQATKDSLTRLWNRSSILEQLERELRRSEREYKPVGVALIDLDNFKSINDTYGHIAGDAVLRESARRMQASIRSYDSLGRYGGEEFLLIMPGCDDACVRAQAERVRAILQEEAMQLSEKSLILTASFGTTAAMPGSRCLPETLIRMADEALYRAKASGRNCVMHTPSLGRLNAALYDEDVVLRDRLVEQPGSD